MIHPLLIAVVLGAGAGTAPGAAGPAEALLAQVDAASNAAGDAHLAMELQTTEPDGEVVTRKLELWQRGSDKRLIRFSAPAKLKGTAILVRGSDSVYLYIPSYGRARRVAGKALGDGFVGTDFAIEDLARTGFARDWAPTAGEDGDRLSLTPRGGKELASARIELTIRPVDRLPSLVEHYDDKGAVMRRIRFDDVRLVAPAAKSGEGAGTPLAHSVVVQDVRAGRTTRATVTSAELDTGLPDELFSLTRLKR